MEGAASDKRFPLSLQLVLAVVLAVLCGTLAPQWFATVGDVGLVVIKLLKVIAAPLLFFAVVDAFWTADIPARSAVRLVSLSALNAVVATVIGLSVAHLFAGGKHWVGKIEQLMGEVGQAATMPVAPSGKSVGWLERLVPAHFLEPFMGQNVLAVVAVALVVGVALRGVNRRDPVSASALAHVMKGCFGVTTQILTWLIVCVPVAVFFVVASVVARNGVGVFSLLGWFVLTVLVGMVLHAVVYYSFLCVVLVRRSPLNFFSGGADAIVTALSCGSSLATLPVTLRCLEEKLKVRPESARLAACVGTNLNHDGIILYEATTAIFVAQALGWDLSLGQQMTIAVASVLAGIGIAGVPEAGLITLPLVLAAAGVDERVVVSIVPLLFTVDWFIGRLRAAVNVTSDMIVACVIDRDAA